MTMQKNETLSKHPLHRKFSGIQSPKTPVFFLALCTVVGVIGCHLDSTISGLNSNTEKSKKKVDKEQTSSLIEPENEDTSAQEPIPVSGAFLTCVRTVSYEDPGFEPDDGEGVACGVRTEGRRKVNTGAYKAFAKLINEEGSAVSLEVRAAPDNHKWNYFVYFNPKILFSGNLVLSLSKENQAISLSFPMEKIQENTVKQMNEEFPQTGDMNPSPSPSPSGDGSPPNSPPVLKSSHNLSNIKGKLLADAFHPSMFCKDGVARIAVDGSSRELESLEITQGVPITLGSPDLKKAECFGKLRNKEDLRILNTAFVVEDRGCLFMRDRSTLYIFDANIVQSGGSKYDKKNLDKLALMVPPCE